MAKTRLPVAGTIGKSVKTVTAVPPQNLTITQAQLQAIIAAVNASQHVTNPSGLTPTDWSLITSIPSNLSAIAALVANGMLVRNQDGTWRLVPVPGPGQPGEAGPPGEDGIPGVRGIDGVTGAQGPVGPALFFLAEDGVDGDVGPQGLPGPSGGPPGPTGATGPTGAAGAAGAAGPALYFLAEDGINGTDGVPGPRGTDGSNGSNGASGAQGPMGPALYFLAEDGVPGEPGPPGPAGATGSGGTPTVGVPGTIPDLVFWFESDDILGASGAIINRIRDRTPWIGGIGAAATGAPGVAISGTQVNSLNVLAWPNGASGRMAIQGGGTPVLDKVTVFAVVRPAATGVSQVLLGAPTGGLEFDLDNSNKFTLTKTFVAVLGSSTATFAAATTYQVNATFDSSTGAYAFRVARATSGSGTTAQAITAQTTGIGYNVQSNSQDLNASVAAIIVYNRVLTGPEIAAVEAYLLAKWGV